MKGTRDDIYIYILYKDNELINILLLLELLIITMETTIYITTRV